MTPQEFLSKIISYRGPCLRLCAYCPEDFNTAEVKECVEEMIRTNYKLRQDLDELKKEYEHTLKELNTLRTAYREAAGHEY